MTNIKGNPRSIQDEFSHLPTHLRYYYRNKEKVRVRQKKYRQDNLEHVKALEKARRPKYAVAHNEANKKWVKEHPEERLFTGSRQRAKKNNLEFNILRRDIIIPSKCPILGIELVFNKNKPGDSSPSLDRVDNTKGYIKDNIRVISMRANRLKSNLTKELMLRMIEYIDGKI